MPDPCLSVRAERWPIAGAFTISRGSKTEAVVVVAELSDGTHRGRGEAVPYARYGETPDGVVTAIEAMRPAKDHFVARLSGIRDRNAASALVNTKLYVPRERLPQTDEPDEFYHADLVGLAVVDQGGRNLGTVVAIHNFGAGDLIEVRPEAGGNTELVPFDTTHVPAVDIAAGKIIVDPRQGLFKTD